MILDLCTVVTDFLHCDNKFSHYDNRYWHYNNRFSEKMTWGEVVWCDVMWYDVVWYDVVWCGMMWYGLMWCGMMWCGMMWYDVVWYDVVWFGVVWCGVMWYDVVWCDVHAHYHNQNLSILLVYFYKRLLCCIVCRSRASTPQPSRSRYTNAPRPTVSGPTIVSVHAPEPPKKAPTRREAPIRPSGN